MCGEHLDAGSEQKPCPGSSPHVRGALLNQSGRDIHVGIIPACAGSTCGHGLRDSAQRDHPRMCGEHSYVCQILAVSLGSSPHVRGALSELVHCLRGFGIIPACAGSTNSVSHTLGTSGDHPRMCGEHICANSTAIHSAGSSPHVRGAPQDYVSRYGHRGIIPACAGSTTFDSALSSVIEDHPRMCGEHTLTQQGIDVDTGSSPHVRGALATWNVTIRYSGIIPACAGSTKGRSESTDGIGDHPRMCGEHQRSPRCFA